jgi:hypothetical protein
MTSGAGTGPRWPAPSSLQPTLGERTPNPADAQRLPEHRAGRRHARPGSAPATEDATAVTGRAAGGDQALPDAGPLPDRAVTLDVDQVRELRLLLGTLARWADDRGAPDLAHRARDLLAGAGAGPEAVAGR